MSNRPEMPALPGEVADYLEGLLEGFVVYGPDWRMTYMNAAGERLLGRRRAEVLGKTWHEAFPHASGNRVDQMYQRVMRERAPERIEMYYEHYGRWLEVSASPVRTGGIAVYFRDSTERNAAEQALRESETRYRGIFDAAPVALWEEDFSEVKAALDALLASGVADLRAHLAAHPEFVREAIARVKVTDVNPAAVRMFGARDKQELIASLGQVFLPEAEHAFAAELVAIAERRAHFEGEEALRTLRGERLEVLFSVAFPPGDAQLRRVLVTISDITARKQAEARLREADRRKDEFLATLAHELRNPLAPLRNSLHFLRLAGNVDPALAPMQEMMERQVNHLVRLVDDLLEVSRISRGALELRRERVELAAVVRNAVETSAPLVQAGGHRLELELPPAPLALEGDAVRLAQILSNLLNNAAKYTPPSGRIVLQAAREDGFAVVRVSDNGPGISAEALARLFEMFSRGEQARAGGQAGLGIGLALSRRLAEMHGGTLQARSDGPGRGSEFILRLPLAEGESAHAPPGVPPAARLPQRILVVDDNRDAADSLGMVLRYLGAEVHVAHDGRDALAAVREYAPGVVLLDIGMPGMDGYEVARRICREAGERRPMLVALTGWGQEEDRRRAREAGFDHHLIKPADIDSLQALLGTLSR